MSDASRPSAIFCWLIAVSAFAFFGLVERSESASADQAPIAAYSFDTGEGAVAEDVTGNEHDGTIEGAEWTNGKYGSALKFDGEEDCISIPESPAFQFSEEFTLESWVRPSATGIRAIISAEDESAAEEEEPFAYSLLTGGEEEGPKGWLRKGGESGHAGVAGGEELTQNAWSHVALTDDGARIRLYIDGELVATQPAIPLTTANGPLTIGCLAEYGNYFKGKIDEVRIYNRALDPAEVADIEAPYFVPPAKLFALNLSGIQEPYILFSQAVDPPRSSKRAGSGVAFYTYRYSVNGSLLTGWEVSADPNFSLEASAGDSVHVDVYVTDQIGNHSEQFSSSVVIPEEESGSTESEEDQNTQEEEPQEPFEGYSFETTAVPDSSESSGYTPLLVGGAIVCRGKVAGHPHPSTHSPTRVNTVTSVNCAGSPVEGHVRAILFENRRIVRDSGERHFYFFSEGPHEKSAYANVPCIKGSKWMSWGELEEIFPPPNYTPKRRVKRRYRPRRAVCLSVVPGCWLVVGACEVYAI
jgi:hypothetical protein